MNRYAKFVVLFVAVSISTTLYADVETLLDSARSQIGRTVIYDGSYQSIEYPGGDIPIDRGVCSDVIVRAYRKVGFDLQELVHRDMRANFEGYPSKRHWGLSKPDPNIDHRRVLNLKTFFRRHGEAFSESDNQPVQAGDLLTWTLDSGLPHIGIVSDRKSSESGQYLIIHNIGEGTKEENVIDRYKLTGHYRYTPWND